MLLQIFTNTGKLEYKFYLVQENLFDCCDTGVTEGVRDSCTGIWTNPPEWMGKMVYLNV